MTTRSPLLLRIAFLSALLAAGSCGGGGGPAAPTIDLTGYWQLFMTPTGSPDEVGPSPVFLTQTGAALDGAAITGTVSGNAFSATSTAGGVLTIDFDGALFGSVATGNMVISGLFNATGTFRLVRFAPTGTLAATATLQGVAVDMDTTAAIGSRVFSDTGLTVLDRVEITAAYGSEHLEIAFSPGGLAVGALAVPGTVTATVTYRNDVTEIELDASGGTVTVTAFDNNGFAGSFALTLPGGSTLDGSFDVVWDIDAYDP